MDAILTVKNRLRKDFTLLRRSWHLQLLDFQVVRARHSGDFRNHVHRNFELIIPRKHDYRCALNATELICHPGEFLLIQPGQPHRDHFSGDEEFFGFHFVFREEGSTTLRKNLFASGYPIRKQVAAFRNPEFSDQLLRFFRQNDARPVSFSVLEGIFTALFRLLCECYEPAAFTVTPEGQLDRNVMLHKISALFEQGVQQGHLSLDEMCRALHCSQRTLNRLCKQIYNTSPQQAFAHTRMACVLRYMHEHPHTSVKAVAAHFNYANAFYFSRLFRKMMGFAPSTLWQNTIAEK